MEAFISNNRIYIKEKNKISNGCTRTGDVYLLNDKEVIKIFKYMHPLDNDYYKKKLNVLKNLKTKKFIIPINIAFNDQGNIIGYTMRYIKGNNGDSILNYSSKFLIEELEKTYNEIIILSKNNIVIDDLISDNVIINNEGIYFIDVDDYIIRTYSNFNKNINDSNFELNSLLKEIFARMYRYKKNELVNNMFDSYDILYKELTHYYKPNQSVKSLAKRMLNSKKY